MSHITTGTVIAVGEPLSIVEIWKVPLDAASVKFFEPLLFTPRVLDRGTDSECLYAERADLDISAVGIDAAELASCLRSDIRLAWNRIVRRPNNELTPSEQEVKARFLEVAEEVSDE
ncbi:MAG: hypothetical protein ACRC46_12430 [Thermoguttaceae bacterium]